MTSPLLSVFNHVVLPPDLPGKADDQSEEVERDLLRRLLCVVKTLKDKCQDDLLPAWQLIENTLKASSLANEGMVCNKMSMLKVFKQISSENALLVCIREQNAALLIRKSRDDDESSVIFEAFEISPSAEQTLAAKGALQWDFPGATVSIPYGVFNTSGLRESLAEFLEKASIEPLGPFTVRARKAGVKVTEERDTTDPAIITQFLMTVLEVNGKRLSLPVLRKRVKDDVCWTKAKLPWRRNPFWLALRVCVQRLLYLQLGSEAGRIQYKALMCLFLASLLNDCVAELSSGKYELLKVKLCRRLAKLDKEKEDLNVTRQAVDACVHVLAVIEPYCAKSIDTATSALENEWRVWKRSFQRKVPKLPCSASPSDFNLTLPNSIAYFRDILKPHQPCQPRLKKTDPKSLDELAAKNTTKQFAALTKRYSSLALRETEIELASFILPTKRKDMEKKCIDLASSIEDYITAVGDAYDNDSEQMSLFILSVFDMWVAMDKCATAAYPLLRDYHPWFVPEILDILLLIRWKHMKMLQDIQSHIHSRVMKAIHDKMTIFADPSPDSFAVQYFDTPDAGMLRDLRRYILEASQEAREDKEHELERINYTFDDLTEKFRQTTCTLLRNPDGTHDIRGCTNCYYMRRRRRLRISVHEDFLPEDIFQQRAVVFELNPPRALAAYREATWNIINRLCARPESQTTERPEILLSQYSQLQRYDYGQDGRCFSLASHSKSFLSTHYNWKRLPAHHAEVLLPHGLKYSYYDSERELWYSDFPKRLSFAHHFTIKLPKEFPFSALYSSPDFAADSEGPSSYEAVCRIGDCPAELTVHEFTAHQDLMAGKNRRWLTILAELGSSNVNLSLQDTMVLFRHLALQAGPRLEHDSMRAVHVVFRDLSFCNRLAEQISRHVEAIATNWRETNYMETLLTLSIRLFSLGLAVCRPEAKRLLLRIRQITYDWITLLRNETRNAEDVHHSDQAARYCFVSALLCRRTFSPWLTNRIGFDAEGLRCFFEASLAMQESLVVDLSNFSTITRNMVIRDIKMVVRISPFLRAVAIEHSRCLEQSIDAAWPEAANKGRAFTEWRLLPSPYEDWVTSTTDGLAGTLPQVFYFHLLEGHLVIDGQTIGKLPAVIRDSEILRELFGNQRLFAVPSNLPGMDYALANYAESRKVHLGYRHKEIVIQAVAFNTLFELVPRKVFGVDGSFDIPLSLISNCIHWIDLRSGLLEIRQKPRIWKRKEGNWKIDTQTRKAQRRGSRLVDPFSDLAQMISQIFSHFEHPSRLDIFQTPSRLCVELDRDQDAGTFYVLQSMIVMRDVQDWSQRSIIIPLGTAYARRHRSHVLVEIDNRGNYLKYTINNALWRLECPAVPKLLYTKAQLHALTSHLLPDPLTGRTGTQEALSCLQSGYCQPWTPLTPDLFDILVSISNLTPIREYYPKDKRCQQTVHWEALLTANIQHEGYQKVVDAIVNKSERLSQFTKEPHPARKTQAKTVHLHERAHWRRSIYETPDTLSQQIARPEDLPYSSRDGWCTSKRISNLREVVTLLQQQPTSIHTTQSLAGLLGSWPSISGYTNKLDLYDLGAWLTTDFAENWGGLVNLCRNAKKEDVYSLMFQLGLMAFQQDIDMTPIRVLLSFFLLDELRSLALPQYPYFVGFRKEDKPTIHTLLPIIRMSYRPPQVAKPPKRAKCNAPDENMRPGHGINCELEGTELAERLIRQWPCSVPSINGFEAEYVNVVEAIEALLPEWQRMYRNLQLQRHVNQVQTISDSHYRTTNDAPLPRIGANRPRKETMGPPRRRYFSCPRLGEDLLGKPISAITRSGLSIPSITSVAESGGPSLSRKIGSETRQTRFPEIAELENILRRLANSDCSVRPRYALHLEQSITALKSAKTSVEPKVNRRSLAGRDRRSLDEEIKAAHMEIRHHHEVISVSLSANEPTHTWLRKGRLLPALTPTAILQQLRSSSPHRLGPGMKEVVISYGLEIAKMQKLLRLREALIKRDESKFNQESSCPGRVSWNPSDFPDWLLLEIEANIQIRPDQITVALEMISPTSGSNSVLQMNMGQGKTSVIMPMIAAVLANGEILNRLLVPKPLLTQAAQLLQSRLGGLIGREIVHIPFSRRTQTTVSLIGEYRELHESTLRNSGIILGVPEHILSFKLSGLQRLVDSKLTEAVEMVETQKWMNEVCRDVLDECDFTLAVKTQLIYPGGAQLAVDGHPDRWEVAMTVLGLVAHHIKDLAQRYPQSIDIQQRNFSGFPVMHLLRKDVEEALVGKIVDDICNRRTSILRLGDCNEKGREAIKLFLSQEKVERSVVNRVSKLFPDTPKSRKNIYLLRGLLVHGILILCLKKRWNVQYGLHHARDPIAVPFHAKGVPSDQAEWGHPDVAIIFTCLAFYYQGLSQDQVKRSLQAMLKADNPSSEYERWTQHSATLPEALRHWNTITVDDDGLVGEIWRHLRFTTVVINHFLSHFAFPLHAKQFATKLQASGWDVPLYNSSHYRAAEDMWLRPGLTTGFSSTNDNRRLLPLTIEQCDLPGLSHTNAEVLTYLLQPRNRRYRVATDLNGRRLSEVDLLRYLREEKIRVLIDAGAFIIEMDNLTIARTWIQEDWSAKGAVYFDEDNKPWVLYRNFKRVPLFASPFADDLSGCVVYLDEAHTRGTDLKIPLNAVGALTLGLSQTKDHTVQAAMRLRQLGTTQSVTFVAPPEVHQSILDVCKKTSKDSLDSADVVFWLLDQTCATNKELQSLYFAQGKDFCQRMQAATTYKKFLTNTEHRMAYLESLQQPEQQNVEQLYEPRYGGAASLAQEESSSTCKGRLATLMQELGERQKEAQTYDSIITSALEERPVNWILFNKQTDTALVIIPEEAEELIPIMRTSPHPDTHLLLYAAPWTKAMLHFNSLDFYALPSLPEGWVAPAWLPFELGILGGRLYFPFSEYHDLVTRLYSHGLRGNACQETGSSDVAKNRLNFLREWMSMRRQGQDITDTPMGYVCQGRSLRSDHPFFLKAIVNGDNSQGLESLRFGSPTEEEEYYDSDDDGMDIDMDVDDCEGIFEEFEGESEIF
ncbi:hypothetical protein BJX61DRAFT_540599 [Aspergillus egyptiacus]|nr:hypothetical protein BJX61DRAFT_540599 [Aspergillus egyptiacus]